VRALVTGANGFLGTAVVRALLAHGHTVRALVRPVADASELDRMGVTDIVRADLRTARDLPAAFEDVDVLVHLAAAFGRAEAFPATVGGTERLLDAMRGTDCGRVVLASTFSVYDWSSVTGTLDETSPVTEPSALYGRGGYAISKTWQETVTRRYAAENGWELVVLRPGFIWGRGHTDLAAFGQRLGPVQVVIGPCGRIPMTHIDNCADLFALGADDQRATGETFNVVDGAGERIWTFLGEHLRGEGIRRLRVPLPYRPVYGVVRFLFDNVLGRNDELPSILVPAQFEARMKPLRFTNRKARQLLGWEPPLDYRECLRRTWGAPVG